MIIKKIDIKSFGLIRDMRMEFSDSINVIEGQNESGKSTIAGFIKYMLFGFDAVSEGEGLSERNKRINWQTKVAEGTMEVIVKGKKYLISRSTIQTDDENGRVSYKEDSSVIDVESGATAFGKVPAGEVFFGVTKDLFENTAFVGQIGDSSINEDSVKESIENILFSANERINNDRAIHSITERMDVLMHRGGDQGGTIHELQRKQEELQDMLERSGRDTKQILEKESELYRIKKERLSSEENLNKLYDLDVCYKNVMLIQTFDKLHDLEQECDAKNEAYNKFLEENTRAGYVPTESYLTDIAVARRSVNDAYHTLREAEETYANEKSAIGITKEIEGAIETADSMGGEDSILAKAGAHRTSLFRNLAFGILCGLGLIAAILMLALASGDAAIAVRIVGAVIGVGAICGGVFFLRNILTENKALSEMQAAFGVEKYEDLKGKIGVVSAARAKRDGMFRSIENARVAEEKAKAAYEKVKKELVEIILRWGEEPPTVELNAFMDALESKVFKFLEQKKKVLEEKNTVELTVREIRQTLADRNEIDIRAQVSPLKRKALSVVNHDEIIHGITQFKNRIEELDRQTYVLENELMALKARGGDPADCYAKIKNLDEQIAALRLKHKAYFIAAKTIETSSENLRREISPRLGEYSAALMEIMTDKKYSDFDVTDGLKVSYTAEDGEKRTVDFLSGGTRDLAYVAVRMALVDMLYTECPPICFDESFAHQDNARAGSMMKAIAALSREGYQSFVFTCRGREAALAKEHAPSSSVFKLSVVDNDVA